MKHPDSEHQNSELAELAEALRRDAAQLPDPAFNPALHAAVMRQVRGGNPEAAAVWSGWRPWAQAFAAVALLVAVLGYWWPVNHRESGPGVPPEMARTLDSARASVAGLEVEIPAAVPDWMSPTAALLDFSFASANPPQRNL